LVEEGRSRSLLIFAGRKVVASCQYGTFEELPRIENAPRYADNKLKMGEERGGESHAFRRHFTQAQGSSKMALDGALDRIARGGGGLVEAYPVTKKTRWKCGLVLSVCSWREGSRLFQILEEAMSWSGK